MNLRPDPPVFFSSYPKPCLTGASSAQEKSLGFDKSRSAAFSRFVMRMAFSKCQLQLIIVAAASLKQIGNARKRDPRRRRGFRQQHARRHQRINAVFVIERVQRARQARPPRLGFESGEEV